VRREVAELVIRKCMGYRPKETILIVADTDFFRLATAFYETSVSMGIETVFMCMQPRDMHGEEPPEPVARALQHADIALLVTKKSLSHTVARRIACEQHGVRIASMPGVDGERIDALVDVDYDEMGKRGREIFDRLAGGREVRLASPGGTDLRFRIAGRVPLLDGGIFDFPGAFGNLPAGEVYLAPVEGTANGVLMIDGSMAGIGTLSEPIRIVIKEGRAIEISSPELTRMLDPYGEPGRNVAEFGIGINSSARVVGNILEDEKAIGTAHVAFGRNAGFGGTVDVPVHLDGIVLNPRVWVDGKEVPQELVRPLDGRVQAMPSAARDIPSPSASLAGFETYKLLFENANDAQYILDLESQAFIEANAAFSALTGFTRVEILGGKVLAKDLVAPDSQEEYQRKRETRRKVSAERYDIKIRSKSGDVKTVEVSVQRMQIGGRDVVIGAMRDLTEREKMAQKLKDQVKELAQSTLRTFALTEKIKNVPSVTPVLLHAADEKEILEKAGGLLCDRHGMGYVECALWLVRGQYLEPAYSYQGRKLRRYHLQRGHKYAKIARGESPSELGDLMVAMPLKGRERTLGLIEVRLEEREKRLMEGNPTAKKGYLDVLDTLANMIGLIIENMRLYETVRMQSMIDQLTQAYNRRYFDKKLKEETKRALRYTRQLAILIIDVDHFKEINDTYGHKQGDVILQELSRLFKKNTREGVDVVCRYGGDEFILLLPETSLERASLMATKLLRETRTHPFPSLAKPSQTLKVTLSLGVSAMGTGVQSEDDLVRTADEALYESKRGGRNRVSLWSAPVPSAKGT